MATEILRPNGAGSQTQIGAQYPSFGSHYNKVNEEIADDDASYVYTTSASSVSDLYALPSLSVSGVTINSITVYAKGKASGNGDGDMYIRVKTPNGIFQSYALYLYAVWGYTQVQRWTVDPNTGLPFTLDDINAMEIGVTLDPDTSSDVCYCTQVYVEVDYTAQTTYTSTVSMSALLRETDTETISIDTLIRDTDSKTVSLDTYIEGTSTKTVELYTFLKDIGATTVDIDTFLKGFPTKTVDVNTLLKYIGDTTTVSLDVLLGSMFSDIFIDILLRDSDSTSVDITALLEERISVELLVDSYIQATDTKTPLIDVILKGSGLKQTTIDVLLLLRSLNQVYLDVLMSGEGSACLSLDMLIGDKIDFRPTAKNSISTTYKAINSSA